MTTIRFVVLLGGIAIALNLTPTLASADVTNGLPAVCKALKGVDFSQTLDAPTQVTDAKPVNESGDAPGYCEVKGNVVPSVGFILRLPLQNWNGKLLEIGCGGFCGAPWIWACADPLRRGYACIASDMGHQTEDGAPTWAYGNWQAQIDFAYRSTHVTALAGKAIVERYYQQSAHKAYFMGCSSGGRSALMEAQRFPWDFDGIIAVAPSLRGATSTLRFSWAYTALTDRAGKPLLDRADLNILNRAMIKRCDADDGLNDGVIGDPRTCSLDPKELQCTDGKTDGCLTAQKIEAVKKIYSGPVTSTGEPIAPLNRPLKGSELGWLEFVGPPDNPHAMRDELVGYFRYMGFDWAPGPVWKFEDLNLDRDYKRLGGAQGMYDATNPDLRQFKAAGGKLLMVTGWQDAIGSPLVPVDYYETVERTMGGRAATQEFLRLFAVPGMAHCSGGDGAFFIDYLSYLEAWVEKGEAPAKLIGSHLAQDSPDRRYIFGRRGPLDPAGTLFSRPVYPYPSVVKYTGRGDPNSADNFKPVQP